jgi:hypothetical protein
MFGRNVGLLASIQKDFKKSFLKILFGLLDSVGLTILRKVVKCLHPQKT